MRAAPALVLAAALGALPGCGGCEPERRSLPATAPVTSADAGGAPAPPPPPARLLVDFVRDLPGCDVEHRGPLLDAGTEAMVGRYGWTAGVPAGITLVEHDGSTWARALDRKMVVSFTLTEPSPVFVAARAVGYSARAAAVALDDQPIGTLSFLHGQPRIASTTATTLPVDRGLHQLTLRFFGRARDGDAFADLDWLRIGIPDDATGIFGPPTLHDLVAPAAALAGVPHRALALRAPGSVRCTTRLPEHAHLRVAIGLQGAGTGDAEVRAHVDGKKPEVLRAVHLDSAEHPGWTDLDLPLPSFGPGLVGLELRATSAPRGGRVLFGDATVALAAPPAPPSPQARAVIIVVLDGVERAELPPWHAGPTPDLAALTELTQTLTTFLHHRAPTSVVAAVMATLLTGLPPTAHTLTDAGARLPAAETTIGGVARDASVHTAMFTGVPSTFRAFGFGAAWERFVELSPSSGEPATAPVDAVAPWVTEVTHLKEGARMLAVVHARGGHPPWDVTAKELGAVAPADYTGVIEPRRAAQSLLHLRKRRVRSSLTEADLIRVRALETLALAGQDRAIGALVAALRAANLWDQTLFIVTADVGSGASESALFADGLELKEPVLDLPLYVHFPGGLDGGKAVTTPSEVADLAYTSLGALGLSFGKPALGHDLAPLASGLEPAFAPQIATLDTRYAVRWGDLVLTGRFPSAPALCDAAVDATCAFNRRDAMPLTTFAMFRRLVAFDLATRVPPERREPATIDPDTAAALSVWGATD